MSDVEEPSRSAPLRVMADRMDLNKDAPFAGAFVIIPPDGSPQDMLIIDSSADPAIFWSTMLTRVQIAMKDLDDAGRSGGGFGGGRR